MKLSWEWKLFLLNTICQSLFVIYSSVTLYIGLKITLPFIYSDDPSILFNRKVLAVVLFCNVLGNYLCIKYKSMHSIFSHQTYPENTPSRLSDLNWNHSNGDTPNIKSCSNGLSQAGSRSVPNLASWIECGHCNGLAPPRSKHCGLCRACVLKRDHHCFFAGCCIGFHNQRYFIIFCLYGILGALYSTFATSGYLRSHYAGVQDWGLLAYLLPVLLWFWLTGAVSGSNVLMVLFLYWSFFTAAMCTYFFALQIFLVLRGQTKFEFQKNVFQFHSNPWNNFQSVFGPGVLGFIGFLAPTPCLGYFGDGKTWDELNCSSKLA